MILIILTLCGIASSLITTRYALLLNPLARSFEELRPEGFMNETSCSIIVRTALVASTVCIAFLLPFFGKHAPIFLNCASHITVYFCYPENFLYIVSHNSVHCLDWTPAFLNYLLCVLGLVMALIWSLLSILVVSFFFHLTCYHCTKLYCETTKWQTCWDKGCYARIIRPILTLSLHI